MVGSRRDVVPRGRTLGPVERRVVGFAVDAEGEQVVLLDCHHRQHVRHQPPFRLAAWVHDAAERTRRVGTGWPCPLCDRCEIPADLVVLRTTTTWDEHTLPDALRRSHRVASGRWGRLRVARGSVRFVAHTEPVTDVIVDAPAAQGIPPDVEHHVEPRGPVLVAVDFLGPAAT
jgi:tellurite methyltransferase